MAVARAVADEPARPSLCEERSSGRRPRGVASANASRDRNLRTTRRRSHPWNHPKICLHRRLKRQHILHFFAHDDAVASWLRAYGVPCYAMCKDQSSLALQRSYRVNLRRDIEDRRIVGALLLRHEARAVFHSTRCLDTCCFLARHLHTSGKPWIAAS